MHEWIIYIIVVVNALFWPLIITSIYYERKRLNNNQKMIDYEKENLKQDEWLRENLFNY